MKRFILDFLSYIVAAERVIKFAHVTAVYQLSMHKSSGVVYKKLCDQISK